MILAGQSASGAYVASPTFEVYGYSWLRDGNFNWRTRCARPVRSRAPTASSTGARAGLSCRRPAPGTRATRSWRARPVVLAEAADGRTRPLRSARCAGEARRAGKTPPPLVRGWLDLHWAEPGVDWWEEREGIHAATLWCIGEGLDSDGDPARSDRPRRRPRRCLAALHRHARAPSSASKRMLVSPGGGRLAQPRRRLLRRRRVAAPDGDAGPGTAGARCRSRLPGSRRMRRRTATCPSRCRTICCAPSATSRGSRSGALPPRPCSGRMTYLRLHHAVRTVRCAIVGSGLAALATYATLRHAGVPVEGDRGVRDARRSDRGLANPRRGDPPAAHAVRVRWAPRRGRVPRACGARGRTPADGDAADRVACEPVPPAGGGLPAARPIRADAKRLGAELPA